MRFLCRLRDALRLAGDGDLVDRRASWHTNGLKSATLGKKMRKRGTCSSTGQMAEFKLNITMYRATNVATDRVPGAREDWYLTPAHSQDAGTATSIRFHHAYQGRLCSGMPGMWGLCEGRYGHGSRSTFAMPLSREAGGGGHASGVPVARIGVPGEGVMLEGGELISAPGVVAVDLECRPAAETLRLLGIFASCDPAWRARGAWSRIRWSGKLHREASTCCSVSFPTIHRAPCVEPISRITTDKSTHPSRNLSGRRRLPPRAVANCQSIYGASCTSRVRMIRPLPSAGSIR